MSTELIEDLGIYISRSPFTKSYSANHTQLIVFRIHTQEIVLGIS